MLTRVAALRQQARRTRALLRQLQFKLPNDYPWLLVLEAAMIRYLTLALVLLNRDASVTAMN